MDDKSERLKTNEEIIEELTKDLESSCIKENDNYTTSKDDIQKSKNGNLSNDCNERIKRNSDDDNWETKCKGDANHEKDNMDEEILKEREQNLSEEEKEVCIFCIYIIFKIIAVIKIHHKIYIFFFFFQSLKAEAEKYKNEGNDLFKREEYLEAISVYTQAIQTCPLAYSKERSILYANRAAAKLKCLVMILHKKYTFQRNNFLALIFI